MYLSSMDHIKALDSIFDHCLPCGLTPRDSSEHWYRRARERLLVPERASEDLYSQVLAALLTCSWFKSPTSSYRVVRRADSSSWPGIILELLASYGQLFANCRQLSADSVGRLEWCQACIARVVAKCNLNFVARVYLQTWRAPITPPSVRACYVSHV